MKKLVMLLLLSGFFLSLFNQIPTYATDSIEQANTITINQNDIRPNYSKSKRIYDEAELFTQNDEEVLDKKIQEIQNKYDIVILIVTINDNLGYSTEKYANLFYDEDIYGNEGILILYDMDERDVYILSVGEKMSIIFNNTLTEKILDVFWDDVINGNYAQSASKFLKEVEHYVRIDNLEGMARLTYAFSSSIIYFPIVLLMSAIITLLVYFFSGRFGSFAKAKQYLKNGEVNLNRKEDFFLHSRTTSRHIPKSSSSGGGNVRSSSGGNGRSSSGSSRSGGGRKF